MLGFPGGPGRVAVDGEFGSTTEKVIQKAPCAVWRRRRSSPSEWRGPGGAGQREGTGMGEEPVSLEQILDLEKIEVHSKAEAVAFAFQKRLI